MGAQQSSGFSDDNGEHSMRKICYYELLQVDQGATAETIKKAYRKRALELHPDRNIDDIELSTRKFAEVQIAYEVLSDPQERAWYDGHRDAILSGQDDLPEGVTPTHFKNVRLTSTEEIMSRMRQFSTSIPFSDEPNGFYGIAREIFEHLALEEQAAAESENVEYAEYPSFGFANDVYEAEVKSFYTAWAGFSTQKSFSWKDRHRLSDAPDRRTRRLMEKDNKRSRETAIHEFNDAVRFLVSFVRKRDPRYTSRTQSEADRQITLRHAAAAQAARSRAANTENLGTYQLPSWAQTRQDEANASEFEESGQASEDDVVEIFECVVCNKLFKSHQQLEAHERSKKHTKAVEQLKRHMQVEGNELDLDAPATSESLTGATEAKDSTLNRTSNGSASVPLEKLEDQLKETGLDDTCSTTSPSVVSDGDQDEDYAPHSAVEGGWDRQRSCQTVLSRQTETATKPAEDGEMTDAVSLPPNSLSQKIGKAKAKRQRKAAKQAQNDKDLHSCSVCAELFDSRTKLFDHIRREGHAAVYDTKTASDRKRDR